MKMKMEQSTLKLNCLKNAWINTCEDALGKKHERHKEWISVETLGKVQERKREKEPLNNFRTRAEKIQAPEGVYHSPSNGEESRN